MIAVTQDGIRMQDLGGVIESRLRADIRLVSRPGSVTEGTAQMLKRRNKDLSRVLGDL